MDPVRERSSRQVFGAVGSFVDPVEMPAPKLVAHSPEVLGLLDIAESEVQRSKFADVFAGQAKLPGMRPWAACYGGHQFGNWAGQLGDGRAITLGELRSSSGPWELQLKGAGETPYSRGADGRAVMRSSVREFLCSEAMVHLGVPTTRALCLVSTGEQVVRDMFYDGHPEAEPGAIVCRVAPSFLRFGSFEIFASRRELDVQHQLLDDTVRRHFPELLPKNATENAGAAAEALPVEVYVQWFAEVARRTAELMVQWMRVGFVHGVMNTDNLSVLGLTIDYGPYGWLEGFDLNWTPNTTDAGQHRYAYGRQPEIGFWNLVQLGNAIVGLVGDSSPLNQGLDLYKQTFNDQQTEMMAGKLGLETLDGAADHELVTELLGMLQRTETDMTIFYRLLIELPLNEDATSQQRLAALEGAFYRPQDLEGEVGEAWLAWLRRYSERARGEDEAKRRTRMGASNPKFVLRNYLAQLAIDAAEQGDGSKVMQLLEVLRRPYDEQPHAEAEFAQKRPEWARHRPGCSMLSCSS